MRAAEEHTPEAPSAPTSIGGRYRVDAPLGRGGAARVYRVVDDVRGGTLALKLLHADLQAKLIEQFELEYQTLASLEHSHTPRVFEFGSDPCGVYYTMELLEGGDLSALAPLPWQTVCGHLRDASHALGLLHARSLVHRDVSPRNLWRLPDGRIKLIDFGALAPFGRSVQVIGTPPCVPPEVLLARPLDQRADLYALGAVAYYLLSGRHAYPARTLEALHELWRVPLPPPSLCVEQLARRDLPLVPKELDALVLALLRSDPLARPSSTAEVIDHIDALLGTSQGAEPQAAYARLTNVAYVGRAKARRTLGRRLALAAAGRGQACVIEAAPGGGRTRALREIELVARVAQTSVVSANAAAEPAPYGVVNALALALLDAAPELARQAARPHAALLAHLSPRLRDRLGAEPAPAPEVAGEMRVRVFEAMRDWIVALAAERPLVVLVDGLEHADEGSVAFLLTLALQIARSRLFLVCALARDPARERGAALRALQKASHGVALAPLPPAELHALLASAFGAAPHLERLSGRLHELTGGNPGHALELCRQLVERGVIHFESGVWLLPRELDTRSLSSNREQALLQRLSRVQGPGRELARALAVHVGPLTPGLCRALAVSGGSDLLPHLRELIESELLVASGQNLLFAHEAIRDACARELSPKPSARARGALAEHIASSPDASSLERLQAGVHWTAIDDPRGPALIGREALQLVFHELDLLAPAASTLEAALHAVRARGCSRHEEITLLTALALAGYEGERRYITRYGEHAVRALEEVLELGLVRRLSPHLGQSLALAVALGVAASRFVPHRKNPLVPSFADALVMLFTAVACSAGAAAVCFDAQAMLRYVDVLKPFDAFGISTPGGFMYQFCRMVALTALDDHGAAYPGWHTLLARLERVWPLWRLTGVPEAQLRRCRGGALFAIATIEVLRDGDDVLRTAEALDRNGQELDRVCADNIRMLYFGLRGDLAAYERYRARAEHHAIARGTTWQLETWLPIPISAIAWNLHDALGMKGVGEQLYHMSLQGGQFEFHARYMRGAYLLLRGRFGEALPWLADCLQEPPKSRANLSGGHGALARAYNRLGDYAHAHAACMRVFAHCSEVDLESVALNLVVQTERAIAEAGLGDIERGRALLEQLHARYGHSSNPVLRGQLFEAGFEIAMIGGDLVAARHQLHHIEALYQPLDVASLTQFCEGLAARIAERSGDAPRPSARAARHTSSPDERSEQLWTIARMRTGKSLPLAETAERALRAVASSAEARSGALYLVDSSGLAELHATLGIDRPSPRVERWIRERLARDLQDECTILESDLGPTLTPWNVLREGDQNHRMLELITTAGRCIGAAVVARSGESPSPCSGTLLSALADRLHEAMDRA